MSVRAGDYVEFTGNLAAANAGYITRVWRDGRTVTIVTDEDRPRTFMRAAASVRVIPEPGDDEPAEPENRYGDPGMFAGPEDNPHLAARREGSE